MDDEQVKALVKAQIIDNWDTVEEAKEQFQTDADYAVCAKRIKDTLYPEEEAWYLAGLSDEALIPIIREVLA